MKFAALALGLLLASSAQAGPITLAGDTVDAGMYFTVNTGYGVGRIRGYGLDAPFLVQDGSADARNYSSIFNLDVDGDRFALHFLSTASWQPGVVFRLQDLDFLPTGSTLASLDVDTNLTGFGLNTGADFVEIALGGTHFTTASYFVGSFNGATVSEPGSLALGGLAMLGLAAASRGRRRAMLSTA